MASGIGTEELAFDRRFLLNEGRSWDDDALLVFVEELNITERDWRCFVFELFALWIRVGAIGRMVESSIVCW